MSKPIRELISLSVTGIFYYTEQTIRGVHSLTSKLWNSAQSITLADKTLLSILLLITSGLGYNAFMTNTSEATHIINMISASDSPDPQLLGSTVSITTLGSVEPLGFNLKYVKLWYRKTGTSTWTTIQNTLSKYSGDMATTFNIVPTSSGQHEYYVIGYARTDQFQTFSDRAPNSGYYYFTINANSPPSVSNVNPTGQAQVPGTTVTITATVTDVDNNLDYAQNKYRYKDCEGLPANICSQVSFSTWFTPTMSGSGSTKTGTIPSSIAAYGSVVEHKVWAIDTMGATAESSVYTYTYSIDNINPYEISLEVPQVPDTGTFKTHDASNLIKAVVADAHSGLQVSLLKFDYEYNSGGGWTSLTTVFADSYSGSSGSYTYYYDLATVNWNWDYRFRVDITDLSFNQWDGPWDYVYVTQDYTNPVIGTPYLSGDLWDDSQSDWRIQVDDYETGMDWVELYVSLDGGAFSLVGTMAQLTGGQGGGIFRGYLPAYNAGQSVKIYVVGRDASGNSVTSGESSLHTVEDHTPPVISGFDVWDIDEPLRQGDTLTRFSVTITDYTGTSGTGKREIWYKASSDNGQTYGSWILLDDDLTVTATQDLYVGEVSNPPWVYGNVYKFRVHAQDSTIYLSNTNWDDPASYTASDAVAPTIDTNSIIINPDPVLQSHIITVTITVTDAESGVATVEVGRCSIADYTHVPDCDVWDEYTASNMTNIGGNQWQGTFTASGQIGWWQHIGIRAVDVEGNVNDNIGLHTKREVFDGVAPLVSDNLALIPEFNNRDPVTIDFNILDINSNVSDQTVFKYRIFNPWMPNPQQWSNWVAVSNVVTVEQSNIDWSYQFPVYAYSVTVEFEMWAPDTKGNMDIYTGSFQITTDRKPPVLRDISFPEGNPNNAFEAGLSFLIEDNGTGLDYGIFSYGVWTEGGLWQEPYWSELPLTSSSTFIPGKWIDGVAWYNRTFDDSQATVEVIPGYTGYLQWTVPASIGLIPRLFYDALNSSRRILYYKLYLWDNSGNQVTNTGQANIVDLLPPTLLTDDRSDSLPTDTELFLSFDDQVNGQDQITLYNTAYASGVSLTVDIGQPGNNRLVAIYAGWEGTSNPFLSGVTIDGIEAKLLAWAHNSEGGESQLEMYILTESALKLLSSDVDITIHGVSSTWGISVLVFYGVEDSTTPFDLQIDESSIGESEVDPRPIDIPTNGLVIFGANHGNTASWSDANWDTNPTEATDDGLAPEIELTETTDFVITSTAILGSAYWISNTGDQYNRQFRAHSPSFNRATGIIATFRPAVSSILDYSENKYELDIHGTPTFVTSDNHLGMEFSQNEYLELNVTARLNDLNSYTLMFDAKFGNLVDVGNYDHFFDLYDGINTAIRGYVYELTGNYYMYFYLQNDGGTQLTLSYSTTEGLTEHNDGIFHNFAFVYDYQFPGLSSLTLFIDGVAVDTVTTTLDIKPRSNPNQLLIGRDHEDTFDGVMDNFLFASRAFSRSEIAEISSGGYEPHLKLDNTQDIILRSLIDYRSAEYHTLGIDWGGTKMQSWNMQYSINGGAFQSAGGSIVTIAGGAGSEYVQLEANIGIYPYNTEISYYWIGSDASNSINYDIITVWVNDRIAPFIDGNWNLINNRQDIGYQWQWNTGAWEGFDYSVNTVTKGVDNGAIWFTSNSAAPQGGIATTNWGGSTVYWEEIIDYSYYTTAYVTAKASQSSNLFWYLAHEIDGYENPHTLALTAEYQTFEVDISSTTSDIDGTTMMFYASSLSVTYTIDSMIFLHERSQGDITYFDLTIDDLDSGIKDVSLQYQVNYDGNWLDGGVAKGVSDDLVAYYPLDDSYDYSGNENHATNMGVTFSAGKVDNAGYFVDSEGDYLSLNATAMPDWTSDFSIAFWMYPNGLPVSYNHLWNIRDSVNGNWMHLTLLTSGKIEMGIRDDVGFTSWATSTTLIVPDTWTYVTYTWDASETTRRIYLDSVWDVTHQHVGSYSNTANQAQIGAYNSIHNFNGMIDEARIYSRVISQEAINQNYAVRPDLYTFSIPTQNDGDWVTFIASAEDNDGNIAEISHEYQFGDQSAPDIAATIQQTKIGEAGSFATDGNSTFVSFDKFYANPVVIVQGVTLNGVYRSGGPLSQSVLIHNTSSSGFWASQVEDDYVIDGVDTDGYLNYTTVNYFVIEAGTYRIGDLLVEAGTMNTTGTIASYNFLNSFTTAPAVFGSLQHFNVSLINAIERPHSRFDAVTAIGFSHFAEKVTGTVAETYVMGYIAVEIGLDTTTGLEVANVSSLVGDVFVTYNFSHVYTQAPIVISHMSDETDLAAAISAVRNITASSFEIASEETNNLDGFHSAELLPYLVLPRGDILATLVQNQDTVIQATVTDESAITSITLRYSTNGGSSWTTVVMNETSFSFYTATLPYTSLDVDIEITAIDDLGNTQTYVLTYRGI
ncbi:MAG: hypothetical protein IH840_00015 [Candidatus Heimdallarchaeota archaeon]|nr:hypothetical protein [Candidatus Heimdallarchaeota archaeon]